MGGMAIIPVELLDALEREAQWAEAQGMSVLPGIAMFRGCVETRQEVAMVSAFTPSEPEA